MGINDIVARLTTLEVFLPTVEEDAEIFAQSATLEDVRREMRPLKSACSPGQFVYFHLGSLLELEPEYKTRFLDEATQRLDGLGISPEHIRDYFQSGSNPELVFGLNHGKEYSEGVRKPFYEKANQFALDKMREWLGIAPNS